MPIDLYNNVSNSETMHTGLNATKTVLLEVNDTRVGFEVEVAFGIFFLVMLFTAFLIQWWVRRQYNVVSDENVERPRLFGNGTCAICLNDNGHLSFPLETQCGHVFCGQCFRNYYNVRYEGTALRCPTCRQGVTLLFKLFGDNLAEYSDYNVVIEFMRYYNRLMANNLTLLERIAEMPVLLRRLLANFLDGAGAEPLFHLCFFCCFLMLTFYVILPMDVIPEVMYGLFGYFDDLSFIIAFVAYFTMWYRNIINN